MASGLKAFDDPAFRDSVQEIINKALEDAPRHDLTPGWSHFTDEQVSLMLDSVYQFIDAAADYLSPMSMTGTVIAGLADALEMLARDRRLPTRPE